MYAILCIVYYTGIKNESFRSYFYPIETNGIMTWVYPPFGRGSIRQQVNNAIPLVVWRHEASEGLGQVSICDLKRWELFLVGCKCFILMSHNGHNIIVPFPNLNTFSAKKIYRFFLIVLSAFNFHLIRASSRCQIVCKMHITSWVTKFYCWVEKISLWLRTARGSL